MRPSPVLLLLLGAVLQASAFVACGDDGAGGSGGAPSSTGAGPTTTAASTTSAATTSIAATTTNAATTTTGAGGGACDGIATFDGVDDVLLAPVGPEVGLADGFSVAVAVRPDPLPPGGTYFVAGRHTDGDSNGYYFAIVNEGGQHYARFIVFVGTATCFASAPITLPSSGLLHLLGSWQSPDVSVFVGGQPAITSTCGNFAANIDPASVFSVGRSSGGVFPYAGVLGEVAYYAQPFSAPFDPATLGCGSNAALRYTFDGVAPGRTTTVDEVCGTSADAGVGSAAGADAQDPAFSCE